MSENRRISIKAILLGSLADLVSSLVVSLGYIVILAAVLMARGATRSELDAVPQRLILLGPILIIGWACSVLGGFVAGRVAKRSEVMHGGIVGLAGILVGLLVLLLGSRPVLWDTIASFVGTIPFAMLGGRLAATNREKARSDG
jgi:hypothetical protein